MKATPWIGACLLLGAAVIAIPRGKPASTPLVRETSRLEAQAECSRASPAKENFDPPQLNTRFRPQHAGETLVAGGTGRRIVSESAPASGSEAPPEVTVAPLPLIYRIGSQAFSRELPGVPLEMLETMRQEFERQVGADRLPIDSPEYADRWNRAAPGVLDRMRTLFGWAAVAEFERQVAAGEEP